jgi:hypothetical protein
VPGRHGRLAEDLIEQHRAHAAMGMHGRSLVGTPRRVTVGAAADLLLLHGSAAEACSEPEAARVRATILRGELHPVS